MDYFLSKTNKNPEQLHHCNINRYSAETPMDIEIVESDRGHSLDNLLVP